MAALLTAGIELTLWIAPSSSGTAMLVEIFKVLKGLNNELASRISLGSVGFEPVAA